MNRQRLGCMTLPGLLGVVITLVLIVGVGLVRGGILYSPGPLNASAASQPGAQALGGVLSHAELENNCAACHPSPWQAQGMAERCLVCHASVLDGADFHAVMLAESDQRGFKVAEWRKVLFGAQPTCQGCHTEHGGADAALTVTSLQDFPHNATGFSLAVHIRLADGSAFTCTGCHTDALGSYDETTCTGCHMELDPDYMRLHQADFGAAGCLACHDGHDRYSDFSHTRLAFPLDGSHAQATCGECHAGAQSPEALHATPRVCVACHQEDDAHQGHLGDDCAVCHTPESWESATFDHSQSTFPLTGAHEQVECSACHNPAGSGSVFAGTPSQCVACHAEPALHLGLFGDDCAACHTTQAWSPAEFDRPHIFPMNHGESGASSCATCHPDGLTTYTCYACHEHNPQEVAEEHREEGISDFTDCTRCHPTGQEDEAEGGDDD